MSEQQLADVRARAQVIAKSRAGGLTAENLKRLDPATVMKAPEGKGEVPTKVRSVRSHVSRLYASGR